MREDDFEHILCAIRGIPESRRAVTRAIDLALEHDARLTFCFIIDVEFLGQSAPTLTTISAAYEQLKHLGEFSMMILCDRAERRGVKRVDFVIRKGELAEQLGRLVGELDADFLVIGRPVPKRARSVFDPQEFDEFIESLELKTGVQVIQIIHDQDE